MSRERNAGKMMTMACCAAFAAGALADCQSVRMACDDNREREIVRKRVTGYEFQPGTPETDAKRFYSNEEKTEFVEFNYDEAKAGELGKDYTLEDPLRFVDGRIRISDDGQTAFAVKRTCGALKKNREAEPADALGEMLEFARMAELELKHTPTCGEKQSTFGSGDSTPRAVRTAICALSVFDTLGKSDVADAAHWEELAAEVDKTLFFAAKTSVDKGNEALFKCFDGYNWGKLGLLGFTEDFPRLEDADPFMKGNPRPLTVRTDPDWFPGIAEAELPVAGIYDRDARRAERAYRASCRYRGVSYAPPGRDVRTGGFLGLVRGVELTKGWYEGNDYFLDTEIRETAPMGEGEGPNTVLRRQLHVRKTGLRTALVRERVFVLKDCELPRGLLAVPFAAGAYLLLSGENRRVDGCCAVTAGKALYDVTYAVDADEDAERLGNCRGQSLKTAYVTEPGDETEIWQAKIDGASAVGGGTVTVPAGAHKVAQLELKDNVTLELAEGATLFAVTNGTAYRWMPWVKAELQESGVVVAYGATNIGIVGKGTIDGCGNVRPFFRSDEVRWRNVYMRDCRGVRIAGIRLDHPSFWSCFLRECEDVRVKGLTIRGHSNYNNDGLDLCVANALVEDCDIDTDDDALVIKNFNPDWDAHDVEIRNCRISSNAAYIKFGTETFGPMRRYDIHHCEFLARTRSLVRHDVDNPIWPGLTDEPNGSCGFTLLAVDGGLLEDVRIHDITMRRGVRVPFCGIVGRRNGKENWGRSTIRNLTLERIVMTDPALTGVGCFLKGLETNPIENVVIRDCSFRMMACPGAERRLHEKFPENASLYPWAGHFNGPVPGSFLFLRRVHNVRVENVRVEICGEGERRPVLVTDDNPSDVSVSKCGFDVFAR